MPLLQVQTLHMADAEGVARAHALARLLGFLYSDGSLSYIDEQNIFSGVLNLGHLIDTEQASKDIVLVTDTCLKVVEPQGTRNTYQVRSTSGALAGVDSLAG